MLTLLQHRVVAEDVLRSGPSEALTDAVFEIATVANDHLITAKSFAKDVPKDALPALLSAVRLTLSTCLLKSSVSFLTQ